jgi:hypothetical protein
MYDLNQMHHPIIVTEGTHKGRTGETIEQNPTDPTTVKCVLVRKNGKGAYTATVPYDHIQSRFAPGAGLREVYFRREGLL